MLAHSYRKWLFFTATGFTRLSSPFCFCLSCICNATKYGENWLSGRLPKVINQMHIRPKPTTTSASRPLGITFRVCSPAAVARGCNPPVHRPLPQGRTWGKDDVSKSSSRCAESCPKAGLTAVAANATKRRKSPAAHSFSPSLLRFRRQFSDKATSYPWRQLRVKTGCRALRSAATGAPQEPDADRPSRAAFCVSSASLDR